VTPGECPTTRTVEWSSIPDEVSSFFIGGMTLPTGATAPPLTGFIGDSALWVAIGSDTGTVEGLPEPDGRLGLKLPTYRLVTGRLSITARRLDGPKGAVSASVPDGYGTRGFQAAGIEIPAAGCWAVTETVGSDELSFVFRVIAAENPSPT
jgi:hypothetical protein